MFKRRYFKLDIHFDINISQVSKTEEIIINRKNKKVVNFRVACHMCVCVFCISLLLKIVLCRAQLIVLNSSSIPPLVYLPWASGEHFENKPTCINIL